MPFSLPIAQKLADRAAAPPPLALLLQEMRSLAKARKAAHAGHVFQTRHNGRGHPVLVLPGFLASDSATSTLRRTLNAANYASYGWGMGRNLGIRADIFERIDQRMDHIQRYSDEPVTLIGWSLGGLVAREYAKYAPDRVARVITLGSPFSGDLRANHAWRLYEIVAWHRIDCPPVQVELSEKPPVPTYAVWSRMDGVIADHCARGLPHESDLAIEVRCGHMGFISSPEGIEAVFRALQADDLLHVPAA